MLARMCELREGAQQQDDVPFEGSRRFSASFLRSTFYMILTRFLLRLQVAVLLTISTHLAQAQVNQLQEENRLLKQKLKERCL